MRITRSRPCASAVSRPLPGSTAALAVGRVRIAGEKPAVRADQRVELAWAAPDERVELLEILRQDRNSDHAVERTVVGRTSARKHEKRRAKLREPRRHDFADISADIAGNVRAEEAALAGAQVGRHLHEKAGDERLAVAVDEKDRAQLRQRVDDALHALVQARLLFADLVVRHAAHDLVDLGDGALDRLKHLERVLVKDIERTLDTVVGDGHARGGNSARRQKRTARGATRPMQPSSAAAVELPIGARNALHIISRNRNGDDEYPFRSAAPRPCEEARCRRISAAIWLKFSRQLLAGPAGRAVKGVGVWLRRPPDRSRRSRARAGADAIAPLASGLRD